MGGSFEKFPPKSIRRELERKKREEGFVGNWAFSGSKYFCPIWEEERREGERCCFLKGEGGKGGRKEEEQKG